MKTIGIVANPTKDGVRAAIDAVTTDSVAAAIDEVYPSTDDLVFVLVPGRGHLGGRR